MDIFSRILNGIKCARQAKKDTGAGYFRQLAELYRLSRSPNLIGPAEYFEYRLYDPALTDTAKRQFLGYKAERIYSRLNQSSWHGTANDKILFEQAMLAAGFKIPRTLAIYHPWRVGGLYYKHVRTREDLEQFLAKSRNYPMFVKPVHGLFGRGANLVTGYRAETKVVITKTNPTMSLEAFHQWLENNSRVGMLFQETLKPSKEVQQVCGERLSSVRMIVLSDENGPQLFRANWKLCTGSNLVDNTESWTNGNVVAAVDHLTGQIHGAYRGVAGEQVAIDMHPDTHVPLIGLKVPHWDDMKDFVEAAASLFPGLRFQAWDIASTVNGICAIELNLATLHTVHATQLVSHRGFLDAKLAKEMKPFL